MLAPRSGCPVHVQTKASSARSSPRLSGSPVPGLAGRPRPAAAPAEGRRRRVRFPSPRPGPVRAIRGGHAPNWAAQASAQPWPVLGDMKARAARAATIRKASGRAWPPLARAQVTAACRLSRSARINGCHRSSRGAEQFRASPFGERRIVLGVRAPQSVWLSGGAWSLPGVDPHRLQQPVPARLVRSLLLGDHRLAHQAGQAVQDVPPLQPGRACHGSRRGGVEAGGEDPQGEDTALGLAEQRVGPLDGGLQRLLAASGVGAAAGQQPEPLIEQPGDLGRAQRRDPGGGQLDRQRDPVELLQTSPTAATFAVVSAEVATRGTGPLDEEGHRIAGGGGRHVRVCGRQRQRPQPEHLLPAHAQRLPAGGQDAHPAAAAQDVRGQRRRRVRQVLAVVQDQQQRALGAQELHDAAGHRQTGPRTRPQGGRDSLRHRLVVNGRVKLAQPRPITERWQLVGRDVQREASLADPADAGHGDQRRPRHRCRQVGGSTARPTNELS